ncbi:MAG: glycosyltransferase family 4 protein [Chitinophagaceae bacterium]
MNILLIHQYFLEDNDSGGSRWNEMTKVWTEQGNQVTVLAGMLHANKVKKRDEYKGLYFKNKQQDNVNVWRCHVSESYNKSFMGRLWGYFSFMFSSLWAGVFKAKGKFDVVIVTSPPLFVGFSGFFVSRIKKIPLIFEVRDLWPESAIDTGVLKNRLIIKLAYWFENFIYKKSRLINVLTPAFRDTLIYKKKVPSDKIVFIPNAADFSLSGELLQHFDAAQFRRDHGLEKKLVCTYVGAHGVANHLIQIIDTATLIKNRPVIFQLIGDGMEKKMLRDEVAARGLNNVRLVDSVPKSEIFKYILASDIGMSVLKKVDTFKTVYSNKTFDYMSCKKPILMAIDGVSRKLVEDAEAGYYVEPENVQDYIRVLDYYLEHPEVMALQGENGYKYAKENFDRNVLAKRYLAHIREIVNKPRLVFTGV